MNVFKEINANCIRFIREEKLEFFTGWLNDEELAEELMKEEEPMSDEELEAADQMLEEWMETTWIHISDEDD